MAQRTIATKIAIDGEAQYKAALGQINSELRTLSSALKLSESEFKSNANSIAALETKSKTLTSIQSAQCEKVITLQEAYEKSVDVLGKYKNKKAELSEQIKKNETALEKLKNTEGDTTEEQKKLTAETTRLKKELADNEARLAGAEKNTNQWETSLNKAKLELNNTSEAIDKNNKHLNEAKTSATGCATSIDNFGKEFKKTGNEAKEASNEMKSFGETSSSAIDVVATALIAAGLNEGINKVKEAIMECSKSSIEFESAMAGVSKTTNLSNEELNLMGEEIKQLSTKIPVITTELGTIAENAGQLGIQNENVMTFSRTMADLGVSTNLTGEAAAQTFAKFANITKMDQSDFGRLGSTVVELGNNFATTEADIADMAIRLGAAGTQAKMSQADIVAIATGLSSLGMEAEAGGTAFSKTINMMSVAVETGSDQLNDFAKVAGMSADEFARAYRDDAAGALATFITGLNDVSGHGKSATVLLDELGLTQERLRDALTRSANSGDLFTRAISMGNKAWEENTALTKEASTRYETLESKQKMLANAFNNVKIAVGDQLNPALENLTELGTDALGWIEKFITENEWLVPVLAGVATSITLLTIGFGAFTVIQKIIPMIKAFNAALAANPVLLVVTAITGLVTALGLLTASMYEADAQSQHMADSTKALKDELTELNDAVQTDGIALDMQAKRADNLVDRLDVLNKKTKLTTAEQIEMQSTISELNELYPELNIAIDESTGRYNINTTALKKNVRQMSEFAKATVEIERYTELKREAARVDMQFAENQALISKILGELTEEQRKQIIVMEDGATTYSVFDETIRNAAASVDTIIKSEEGLSEELERANILIGIHEEKINASDEANQAAAFTNETLAARYNALTVENGALNISVEEYIALMQGKSEADIVASETTLVQENAMEALRAKYVEAYNAAYENISGQMGLWQQMDNTAVTSVETLQGALDSQIAYLSNYSENMALLINRDIEGIEILAAKFSDGSVESAAALAGLSTATDDEIVTMIASLGKIEEGKVNLSGVFAEIETSTKTSTKNLGNDVTKYANDFIKEMTRTKEGSDKVKETLITMETDFGTSVAAIDTKIDGMVSSMNRADEAASAASETASSYVSGLQSQMGAVYSAGKKLAENANKGWKDYYVQRSPAKKAIETARQTGESYAMGLDLERIKVAEASRNLAIASNKSFKDELEQSIFTAIPRGFRGNYNEEYVSQNASTTPTINAPITLNITGNIDDTQRRKIVHDVRRELGRLIH